MEVQLKAATDKITTKDEALKFARAAARVCYSQYEFDSILEEEDKKGLIDLLLSSGHHSPFDHVHLTYYLKDIPKFGAMILNNERPHTTSEKSARYTRMQLTDRESEAYNKWIDIFSRTIAEKYPFLEEKKVTKLAQENARYLTSVFTPTRMLHTISFRQLNYLIHFFHDFVERAEDTPFNQRVKDFMSDFIEQTKDMYDERLDPFMKARRLSIFAEKPVEEEFGYSYSTNYRISFAGLAQAHRHRTLDFSISEVDTEQFFIPPILETDELQTEWFRDISSLADLYPQGMLLTVNEHGTFPDFLSRATERLCGQPQWEVMNTTKELLTRYLRNTKATHPELHNLLLQYSQGPKCSFPGISCSEPCPFGPGLGIKRLV